MAERSRRVIKKRAGMGMGRNSKELAEERRRRKDRRQSERRIDDVRMAGIGEIRSDRRTGPRRYIERRTVQKPQETPLVRGAQETAEDFATRVQVEKNRRERKDRRDESRRLDDMRMAGIGEIVSDRRRGLRRTDERRGERKTKPH